MAAILAALAGAGAWFRTYGRKAKKTVMFWKKDEPQVEAPAASKSIPSTPDAPAASPESGDETPVSK